MEPIKKLDMAKYKKEYAAINDVVEDVINKLNEIIDKLNEKST